MKTIRAVAVGGAVLVLAAGIFFGSTFHSGAQLQLQLQTEVAQIQPEQAQAINEKPDTLVRVVAESQGLPVVPFEKLPRYGTYWQSLSPFGQIMAPLPWLPDDAIQVFEIAPNQFLVDNGQAAVIPQPLRRSKLPPQTPEQFAAKQVEELVGLIDQVQTAQKNADLKAMAVEAGEMSLDSEDGGGMSARSFLSFPDPGLWIVVPTNALAVPTQLAVILTNTIPDEPYDVLTKSDLNAGAWAVEVAALYATTNFLPVTLNRNGRTNLFVWARYAGDSTGSGIPDWWLLQYFGTTEVDPYGDPDGDGWNNLQEYQNGTSPIAFNTPPKPKIIGATYNANSGSYKLTWQSSGPVNSFTIKDQAANVIGNATSGNSTFTTSFSPDLTQPVYPPIRLVQANYSDSVTTISDPASLANPHLDLNPQFAIGAGSQMYLSLESVPDSLEYVRIFAQVNITGNISYLHFDLNRTNFVNGSAMIPNPQILETNYLVVVQGFSSNSEFGDPAEKYGIVEQTHADEIIDTIPLAYFVNASRQLKENLKFLLRSATASTAFSYETGLHPGYGWIFGESSDPGIGYGRPESQSDYEYYGFHYYSAGWGFSIMDELRPVQENYLWRNYVFNPVDITTNGAVDTGTQTDWANYPDFTRDFTSANAKYQYTGSGNETPLPLAFSSTNANWLYFPPNFGNDPDLMPEVGLSTNGDGTLALANSVYNYYGLHFSSAIFRTNDVSSPYFTVTHGAGGVGARYDDSLFIEAEQPVLVTVSYYFASETVYLNYIWHAGLTGAPPALPGAPTFSTTNSSPLLITGFNQMITVSGWAKQQILNGYSSKFAYLEQYWDKAYTITNGVATTNSAGTLSPYGDFTPTMPGPAALVTMPDIDTGQRGTGIVNVVKLQLDVNHDGVMDLSFAGPDNTSQANPMKFWVNNDNDGEGVGADREVLKDSPKDFQYGKIRSQRNLEDFARLWICGVPKLPATSGYTITLSMAGDAAINLYAAADPAGGTGYLTDTNAATAQFGQQFLNGQLDFDYSAKLKTINASQNYTVPVYTDGTPQYTNFLFEGAGVGSGQLYLTIQQGTNILAQTSAWLDLNDVKDFYEQAVIRNVVQTWPEMVQTQATSGFKIISSPLPNSSEAKQLAVFIHGWRMTEFDWNTFSQSMFKRLYWQGFQGRFASLRWPTRSADSELFPQMGYITYNRSERIAFKSGTGAAAYLNDLRSRFPDYIISGCSHSMGGIVAMQALKELAFAGQQPVDNWVLMQAAVPAQCFDTNAPNLQMFLDGETLVPTPDVYRNYAAGITNALRPGGKIANFFNPDDFALLTWQLNQAFYVANLLGNGVATMKPNAFFGYSTDGTNSVLSTNVWNQSFYSIIYGGYYGNGPTRAVTNSLELMPLVARPRSLAVGAQSNVHGQIQGLQLNLEIQLGFGGGEADHSGEFNRNIQEPPTLLFYSQLKTNLFIQ